MNLSSPKVVQEILRRHRVHLRRGLGQNFLIDANILEKILAAAELTPESRVLEVGAGIGTLTRELAAHAGHVLVVEMDRSLRPILDETLAGLDNVHIVYGDVLRVDLPALLSEHCREHCRVVANIPFQITSPLVGRLLENKARFERVVLMIQKEVAQRFVARPGTSDYSAMTVFVQYHAEVRLVTQVSRNSFLPPPGVDSAVVHLDPRPEPPAPVVSEALLFAVVHAAFGSRRKTLLNALSGGLARPREEMAAALEQAGIESKRRGETLSVEDFIGLANILAGMGLVSGGGRSVWAGI